MSRLIKAFWFLVTLLLLEMSACGQAAPTPTPVNPEVIYTQAAQTVVAQLTEIATAVSSTPPATDTPLVSLTPEPSRTPLISPTPLPGTASATPLALATLKPPQQTSCDNFQFVADVTYPDGAQVAAGSSFVKTWRVKNLGPCVWNKNYQLLYWYGGEGTNWGNASPVNFPAVVNPGDTMDISVTLTAPTKAGNYSAAFKLVNDRDYILAPLSALTVVITVK